MRPRATLPSEDVRGYPERLQRLRESFRGLGRVAVAFSGGVDSSVLLHVGREVLGADCVAVIADSASLPRAEFEEAQVFARSIAAELVVVRTEELGDERYTANAGDRCYFCKSALFELMSAWAEKRGFRTLAFGEITDDLMDDRPGARAASEFGVRAPLREAEFSKADVRRYAREANLEVAEKPASACLASRIPRGTPVTRERLETVELAEALLRQRGYRVLRVRHHGERALLEVGESEFERAKGELEELSEALVDFGFARTDLGVYVDPSRRQSSKPETALP